MLLTRQVKVRWNPNNIKHYKNLGYTFTRNSDAFTVPVEHLPPHHRNPALKFQCDYCGKEFPRTNKDYTTIKKCNVLNKDSCRECKNLKQIESKETKQELGILTPESEGYWTFQENRLKELKEYIDKKETLSRFYSDEEGRKIWLAFRRYNHPLQEALEELGYQVADLGFTERKYTIPLLYHGFYNDFSNLESALKQFVTDFKVFPTVEQMVNTLNISHRTIQNHGGMANIREKVKYFNANELVDDSGWLNKSSYEWIVARFLIHNTDIIYDREQHPFPPSEGVFRSDFTLYPLDQPDIHVEVWGGDGGGSSQREREYRKTKKRKIALYKKYNLPLISIEKSVFNRGMDGIQEILFEKFSPYISLKYRKLNTSVLTPPSKFTNEQLLNEIMKYSEESNILPTVPILKQHKKYHLYQMVISRFPSYYDFGLQFGKSLSRIPKHYWTDEKIYECFTHLLEKGKDLSQQSLQKNFSGLLSAISTLGGVIQVKLNYYEKFISQIINLLSIQEKIFLVNVIRNRGTNIMNRINQEQQDQARRIVKSIDLDVETLLHQWENENQSPPTVWSEEKIFNFLLELLNKNEVIQRRVLQKYRFYRIKETMQVYGGIIPLKLLFFERRMSEITSLPQKEIEFLINVAKNKGKNISGHVTNEQQKQAERILVSLEEKKICR
mgnify:CR=1 FL=1